MNQAVRSSEKVPLPFADSLPKLTGVKNLELPIESVKRGKNRSFSDKFGRQFSN